MPTDLRTTGFAGMPVSMDGRGPGLPSCIATEYEWRAAWKTRRTRVCGSLAEVRRAIEDTHGIPADGRAVIQRRVKAGAWEATDVD